MVRGTPHSAQTPALRPLTRVRDLRCGDEIGTKVNGTRVRRNGFTVTEVDFNVRSSTIRLISHGMAPHEVCGGQEQSRSTCLALEWQLLVCPTARSYRIHVFGVNNHSGGVNRHATG